MDICSYLEAGNIDLGRLFDMVNRYNVGNNRGATVLVHLADEDFESMPRFELCPTVPSNPVARSAYGRRGDNRNQYIQFKIPESGITQSVSTSLT